MLQFTIFYIKFHQNLFWSYLFKAKSFCDYSFSYKYCDKIVQSLQCSITKKCNNLKLCHSKVHLITNHIKYTTHNTNYVILLKLFWFRFVSYISVREITALVLTARIRRVKVKTSQRCLCKLNSLTSNSNDRSQFEGFKGSSIGYVIHNNKTVII